MSSYRQQKLKKLPRRQYKGINPDEDPIRFYFWPLVGRLYRQRVELCLGECRGGQRVLEIGFGSGISFLNLNEMYQEIYGLDLTACILEVQNVFENIGIYPVLSSGNVLQLPYEDDYFDTVLLISILEHLKPPELNKAFSEVHRVLRKGGQVVYGVPVERPFMVTMYHLLGYDIRKAHFSTEKQIASKAEEMFRKVCIIPMNSTPSIFGAVYEVGHFIKD